jgi:hypothetical protein
VPVDDMTISVGLLSLSLEWGQLEWLACCFYWIGSGWVVQEYFGGTLLLRPGYVRYSR